MIPTCLGKRPRTVAAGRSSVKIRDGVNTFHIHLTLYIIFIIRLQLYYESDLGLVPLNKVAFNEYGSRMVIIISLPEMFFG